MQLLPVNTEVVRLFLLPVDTAAFFMRGGSEPDEQLQFWVRSNSLDTDNSQIKAIPFDLYGFHLLLE